jgi:hypothetical protein
VFKIGFFSLIEFFNICLPLQFVIHFECLLAVIHDFKCGRHEVYIQLFVILYMYYGSCQLSVVNYILLHFITLCVVYECVYGFDEFDNGTLHLLNRVFNFKTVVFIKY